MSELFFSLLSLLLLSDFDDVCNAEARMSAILKYFYLDGSSRFLPLCIVFCRFSRGFLCFFQLSFFSFLFFIITYCNQELLSKYLYYFTVLFFFCFPLEQFFVLHFFHFSRFFFHYFNFFTGKIFLLLLFALYIKLKHTLFSFHKFYRMKRLYFLLFDF